MIPRYVQGLEAIVHLQRGGALQRSCPVCVSTMWTSAQAGGPVHMSIDGEMFAPSSAYVLLELITFAWSVP